MPVAACPCPGLTRGEEEEERRLGECEAMAITAAHATSFTRETGPRGRGHRVEAATGPGLDTVEWWGPVPWACAGRSMANGTAVVPDGCLRPQHSHTACWYRSATRTPQRQELYQMDTLDKTSHLRDDTARAKAHVSRPTPHRSKMSRNHS